MCIYVVVNVFSPNLTLSVMGLGQLAQHFNMDRISQKSSGINAKKYLFIQGALRNNF